MMCHFKEKGFTLLEVSIVLVILGILLTGLITTMGAQSTQKYKATTDSLLDIKSALMSFYVSFKYLPCPDTDGDGIENPPIHTGICTNLKGWLPYTTLGIGGNGDAFGGKFKYLVSGDSVNFFTQKATSCSYNRPVAITANTLRIQNSTTLTIAADYVAFAVLSQGKNGSFSNSLMSSAFSGDGNCLLLSSQEKENCDNNMVINYGGFSGDGQMITFDDSVVFLGDIQLLAELRKTGICALY